MKKLFLYAISLLTVSCANDMMSTPDIDDLDAEGMEEGMMIFMPRAATLSRASSNGYYNKDYYPVNSLFLTAYHRDNEDKTQWYFKDIQLKAIDASGKELDYNDNFIVNNEDNRFWKATGWYWPIQGKMEFLSYWSPKVYGSPEFYEYTHANGSKSAQMVVNAQGQTTGVQSERYEGLDGYTDFLYIAQDKIPCPQGKAYGLTYKHGLAWLTLSLCAHVPLYDSNGNPIDGSYDEAETNRLIDEVKIQKIVINDVSRKGTAYLVPGLEVAWTINPNHIKDQLYTRPKDTDESVYPRGNYAYFTWKEVDNGRNEPVYDYITLSTNRQYLGLYRPSLYSSSTNLYVPDEDDDEYLGNGLLIVPQHKTSIIVFFLIKNGKVVFDEDGNDTGKRADLEVAQKYDLHDNLLEWEPGMHYHYDITFTSSVQNLSRKYEVKVVEKTYEIKIDPITTCYDYEAFGQLVTNSADGTSVEEFKAATFVLDPMHNQGSPFCDEMDYYDGGRVF